jgi:signal transduction histidine kinase
MRVGPPDLLSRQTSLGSHLTIFSKGLLLIAIPVLFQLVLLLAVHDVQSSAREAQTWANHSQAVIARADEMGRLIVQLVATQRGAVLTGNPDFEVAARPAPGEIARQLDELTQLVADSPEQTARIEAIRAAAIPLEQLLQAEQQLLQQGRVDEAAERVRSGESIARLRQVRDRSEPFLAEERRLGEERAAALAAANSRERLVTIAGAVTSLLLAFALVVIFTRGIAARLAVATTNAERLAAGAPLASLVAGSDEIAQLDRVLHQTGDRLAATAAAEQQSRREVEARNHDLAELNHELAQKTRENELFIYSVSHDLRSPLVNLQGFSKELTRACQELRTLLQREDVPPHVRAEAVAFTEQEIPESVHFIRTAVTRASLIIDALLRLSRAGRVEYRWQTVPVDTVVGNILDAMRATINERQTEVIVQPLAPAWGDPVAVEQIFANLIGNAVNYRDPTRPSRIEIGMVSAQAQAQAQGESADSRPSRTYFVRDNGLGIPAAALSKVFVAFQRLHARVTAPGEGIGLALVRRIVDRHQGNIWVESIEGVGSTFYVTLPIEALVPEPAAPAGAAAEGSTPRDTAHELTGLTTGE